MVLNLTDFSLIATDLIHILCNNSKLTYQRQLDDFSHGEMCILAHLCYRENGICAGVLCETLCMTTPRISAAISVMQKKGLVVRRTDPEDRRKVHIHITDEGRLLVNEKRDELTSRLSSLLSCLGEEDAKEYVRIMGRINTLAAANAALPVKEVSYDE